MSTNLTNPGNASREVGTVLPGFGFSGALGADDVQLPRVVLLQSQSKPVADGTLPAGVFFDTLMDEVIGNAFDFVPIIYFTTRVFLEMGTGLRCRSLDMVEGVGDPGGNCEACPHQMWPERGAKKKGPDCTISRNYLGLIVGANPFDGGSPAKKGGTEVATVEPCEPRMAILQWRSMATKAATALNGIHMQTSLLNPSARAWEHRVYRIGVARQQNDLGAFFVPTVKHQGPSDDTMREAAGFVRQTIVGQNLAERASVDGSKTPEDF
jgi:hypothetical protein